MHQAETIVLLFALVAALVVIARKLGLPYPIVLVISGLALSFVPRLPQIKLNPDVVFYFFLPLLLYPPALYTSWRDFRRNLRAILLLATPESGGRRRSRRFRGRRLLLWAQLFRRPMPLPLPL